MNTRFTMNICCKERCVFVAVAVIIGCGLTSRADLLIPEWANAPGAIRHVYEFPTDSLTPTPDLSVSPYAAPTAQITLGAYAEGEGNSWQDPDGEFDTYGSEGSGAWQLGQAGTIVIDLPVADPGIVLENVDILVNIVYYRTISGRPNLSVNGSVIDYTSEQWHFEDSRLGDWWSRTWTTTVSGFSSNIATIEVIADAESGSLVDTVEIYAVPEPTSWAMALLGGLILAMARFLKRTHTITE